MDRNTFTGLFLILIILIGFTYLTRPSEEEIKRERIVQDSLTRVKSGKQAPAAVQPKQKNEVPAVDSSLLRGPFGPANQGTEATVLLQNEHLKVNLSTKGGRIASVELKEYKTYDKKPLILFNGEDSNFGLVLHAGNNVISTKNLYFTPSAEQLTVSSKDSGSVTMRLPYSAGQYIDYIYSLKGDSYKVDLKIVTHGLQNVLSSAQPLSLTWDATLRQKEKDIASEHRYSGAYFNHADNEVDHIGTTKDEKKELGEDGKIRWVSFKQHFFSNVLIAKNGFDKGSLSVSTSAAPGVVKSFSASMQLPAPKQAENVYPLEFYFGPNRFVTLKAQGYDLERQIDLGWGPLKYINRVVVIPIFNFLEGLNWNYGLIILVLTILLKLVLSPLTYKSYLSMAKMRILKPEMDEIKAKVGEDNPTLLQQEYLKLYKKAGVNPLGGCIPMVLQLPIVMAFFFFFPNLFELRQESFLWMKDLSTYDSVINFTKIPLINIDHVSLMCLLMTISTLIITYFNNQTSGATGQMKYIGYITPVIFLGVLNSYPSGLNYYYFLANLLTFVQQMIIRQWVNDDKIHARIQENKKKPETEKKKSKFQQRMDDYMRQQQTKTRDQSKKK
ncbi:membrane protein insertase YidC [Pararcticibacter amylolyticus]|uniref:Membrane protein insertase YidC n=1 Tax=Pararcticibacter amylolyticus TaxID=2173175 RepID=A0A2U2PL64_9SPHI|nr:membrane protein insertase YidC [Pararcticibacter amylolyticus]PWG82147.1 membrane protein insertase YidC [Pararcticibacter amylolyticus]